MQKLKENQALKGIDTSPGVLIEIEDIENKLIDLKTQLEALPQIISQNPYKGLSAFRELDTPFFFGRETFTHQLVDSVQQKPWFFGSFRV
ncbi:MAG: hypothetical protein KDI79_05285, partial [Anaerolineae bacterium]|nr:hypothetical protein [Anaerolineae bacterium]